MDPDTLLNCGRASERLFNLVCDRIVWRHLLKKVDEFSEEKLDELVVFGKKGCPEMMPEVLKEAARRMNFIPNLPLPSTQDIQEVEILVQELLMAFGKRVKIMLVVQENGEVVRPLRWMASD